MLPKLAFKNAEAQHSRSLNTLRDSIESTAPGLIALDAIGSPRNFQSRSQCTQIDSLKLAALSHTALSTQRSDCDTLSVTLPIVGCCKFSIQNKKIIACSSNQTAVFSSGEARTLKTTNVSTVLISLNRDRLQSVTGAMLGLAECNKDQLKLNEDRELLLLQNGLDFSKLYSNLFTQIEGAGSNIKALEMMGVDDALYRLTCLLLNPKILIPNHVSKQKVQVSNTIIDQLCSYIEDNISHPIHLTDLEKLSNVSARTLQKIFQKRFQCSPMEWVKARRLELAFKLLSNPQPGTTVSAIALNCGFLHWGNFSQAYRKHFGETPIETLAKYVRK